MKPVNYKHTTNLDGETSLIYLEGESKLCNKCEVKYVELGVEVTDLFYHTTCPVCQNMLVIPTELFHYLMSKKYHLDSDGEI